MIYNLVDKFLMNDFTKYIAEEINKGDKTDISIFDLGCFQGNFSRSLITKLDPYLRQVKSDKKKEAWMRDQYEHPVEMSHTFDEVLNWFDKNDIDFVSSIPSIESGINFVSFDKNIGGRGTFYSRILVQIGMIFTRFGGEGGLFIMIGRKVSED